MQAGLYVGKMWLVAELFINSQAQSLVASGDPQLRLVPRSINRLSAVLVSISKTFKIMIFKLHTECTSVTDHGGRR